MATSDEETWGESRLDRQDSITADGWSKRSDIEEEPRAQAPRAPRRRRRSALTPVLMVGACLVAAAVIFRLIGAG